ncbi:glycosyltransferase, partial [Bacteroides heparinolyticus]
MEQNNHPLISFGIPVYNAAELIDRTLLSALNQTYPNIEYLFVDD